MSNTCLIGYTGFVGSNLAAQHKFDHLVNSKNFTEMTNKSYDLIVCAGVSAVKWLANKDPAADLAKITALLDVLETVKADEFVLISTIDVYPTLQHKNEDFDCHSIRNHAYGEHHLLVEDFCKSHFKNCKIIRLPALFGPGLKKNIIFDLMHDNCVDVINPKSTFQYYPVTHLWSDISKTRASDLDLVNFFTEPVCTAEIINMFFNDVVGVGVKSAAECHYDLHTKHADVFDHAGYYMMTKSEVLADLGEFILQDET